MTLERPNGVAARAVAALARSARAESVPFWEQGKAIGRGRQAVGARYQRGDMQLSEFLTLAERLGEDPSRIIAQAIDAEKNKSPQDPSAGKETRKDKENGFQHQ
ncbi:hypothetical protein [Pseudoscardovia suis]|uniref:Uncharacterized protein n=1 Tax=Pseudoscardovia suis TaxID=987063 RepID=A0A261F143_9BIFI|nr:hypothetical protein [Pseudoscardovia suis]OZG52795.1 hypothetical protein PSSU_0413 [Pseudoscardovia suis]PJJ64970.1 hypothetical protein CLV65_1522 [Pseudoscardovia suis]